MSITIKDLLAGFDGDVSQVERIIRSNARAEGIKILLDDGEENCFVPKKRLDSKIKELNTLKDSLGDIDEKAIKTLKADKEKLEKRVEAYETQIKDNSLKTHMKSLADEFKSQDPTGMDLLNFIDKDKIVYKEDGTIEGIKEQIKALADTKKYLFNAIQEQPKGNLLDGLYTDTKQQNEPPKQQGGTGLPGHGNFNSMMNGSATQEGVFGATLYDSSNTKNSDKDYYFGN